MRPYAIVRSLLGGRALTDPGHLPILLEPYADAVFLAAVDEFQVFHFLVFHGEEEEAGGGLLDFLFGEHLGVEELLERALLFLVALLLAGFDTGVLRARVRADSAAAHSHATHTPAATALRAITAGAVGRSEARWVGPER